MSLDTDRFREMLLEERQHARAAIDNLHTENPGSIEDESGEESSFDNHLGDIATVTFDREMATTLEDSEGAKLNAIEGALERIEQGTYGMCVRCGNPIAEERLEALPYAELCIDCKRLSER
ncbi:MAG: TraR/DksA family transcriptional regulator [Gaiellaceae bacterium]